MSHTACCRATAMVGVRGSLFMLAARDVSVCGVSHWNHPKRLVTCCFRHTYAGNTNKRKGSSQSELQAPLSTTSASSKRSIDSPQATGNVSKTAISNSVATKSHQSQKNTSKEQRRGMRDPFRQGNPHRKGNIAMAKLMIATKTTKVNMSFSKPLDKGPLANKTSSALENDKKEHSSRLENVRPHDNMIPTSIKEKAKKSSIGTRLRRIPGTNISLNRDWRDDQPIGVSMENVSDKTTEADFLEEQERPLVNYNAKSLENTAVQAFHNSTERASQLDGEMTSKTGGRKIPYDGDDEDRITYKRSMRFARNLIASKRPGVSFFSLVSFLSTEYHANNLDEVKNQLEIVSKYRKRTPEAAIHNRLALKALFKYLDTNPKDRSHFHPESIMKLCQRVMDFGIFDEELQSELIKFYKEFHADNIAPQRTKRGPIVEIISDLRPLVKDPSENMQAFLGRIASECSPTDYLLLVNKFYSGKLPSSYAVHLFNNFLDSGSSTGMTGIILKEELDRDAIIMILQILKKKSALNASTSLPHIYKEIWQTHRFKFIGDERSNEFLSIMEHLLTKAREFDYVKHLEKWRTINVQLELNVGDVTRLLNTRLSVEIRDDIERVALGQHTIRLETFANALQTTTKVVSSDPGTLLRISKALIKRGDWNPVDFAKVIVSAHLRNEVDILSSVFPLLFGLRTTEEPNGLTPRNDSIILGYYSILLGLQKKPPIEHLLLIFDAIFKGQSEEERIDKVRKTKMLEKGSSLAQSVSSSKQPFNFVTNFFTFCNECNMSWRPEILSRMIDSCRSSPQAVIQTLTLIRPHLKSEIANQLEEPFYGLFLHAIKTWPHDEEVLTTILRCWSVLGKRFLVKLDSIKKDSILKMILSNEYVPGEDIITTFCETVIDDCKPNGVTAVSSKIDVVPLTTRITQTIAVSSEMPKKLLYSYIVYLCSIGRHARAISIFARLPVEYSLTITPELLSSLMGAANSCRLPVLAENVVKRSLYADMPKADFDLLNIMLMSILCETGQSEVVLQNSATITSMFMLDSTATKQMLIKALSYAGKFDKAFELFEASVYEKDLTVGSCCTIIDSAGLTNSPDVLQKVWDRVNEVVEPTTNMFNSYLEAVSRFRNGEHLLTAFKLMLKQKVTPDYRTYRVFLNRRELLDLVRPWFEEHMPQAIVDADFVNSGRPLVRRRGELFNSYEGNNGHQNDEGRTIWYQNPSQARSDYRKDILVYKTNVKR